MKISDIDISRLREDPDQPRKDVTEAEIAELADSIKVHGLLQPVIVRKEGDGYIIVAGHRRHLAAQRAGLKTLPCIVRNDPGVVEEAKRFGLQVVENLQREALSDIDLARAVGRMVDEFGMQRQEVAQMLSRSPATVTKLLELLNDQWREYMPAVGESVSAIAQVRMMDDKTRKAVLKRFQDTGEQFNSNQLLKLREFAKTGSPVTPASIPKVLGERIVDIKVAADTAQTSRRAQETAETNAFAAVNFDDDEALVERLFKRENFEGKPLAARSGLTVSGTTQAAFAIASGVETRVDLPGMSLSVERARAIIGALGGNQDARGLELTTELIRVLNGK